jgi:hypothetical protein
VTDAPTPPPEHANSINADVSGPVIQARDITVNSGSKRLSVYNPRFLANKLTGMSLDAGVEMLADADDATAAAILTDLLPMDENKALELLTHMSRTRAEAAIKAMAAPSDWLTDLPAAVEAIQAHERANRHALGTAGDVIKRVEIPDAGRTGFRQPSRKGTFIGHDSVVPSTRRVMSTSITAKTSRDWASRWAQARPGCRNSQPRACGNRSSPESSTTRRSMARGRPTVRSTSVTNGSAAPSVSSASRSPRAGGW